MLEPVLVETAALFPHRCYICSNDAGPMVDTIADRDGERVYLCVLVCVPLYAAVVGYLSPLQEQELADTVAGLAVRVGELGAELEAERASKVVPLAEVLKLAQQTATGKRQRATA